MPIVKRTNPPPPADQQYILDRVTVDPVTGCWNWNGAVVGLGYGVAWKDGSTRRANRLAYEAFIGPLGDDDCLHECDNPACCNPEHLYAGDAQANADDKLRRGRQARGERQGLSRLTSEQVIAILADNRPSRAVAIDYSVSKTTILQIRKGATWDHITGASRGTP